MSLGQHDIIEHYFRHEYANLTAVLTRAFGVSRLELIEDIVQDTLLYAMDVWSRGQVPKNPARWVHRVAKHKMIDALRREKAYQRALMFTGQTIDSQDQLIDDWLGETQIEDSLLRMIFVCCHPSLSRESQIALTLKTLCGFGVHEIASGLLTSKGVIQKRLQRARQKLAEKNVSTTLPSESELSSRLDAVLQVLYLMFNEGYRVSRGGEVIQEGICKEAIRLCRLVCQSSLAKPHCRALLALMLFHASRFAARLNEKGDVVLLEHQDRDKWDQDLIEEGKLCLFDAKAAALSVYHLQAGIAMAHCVAKRFEDTDWVMIAELYDQLIRLCDSPIYRLNRAIAIAQGGEIVLALRQLHEIEASGELRSYALLDCSIAKYYLAMGDKEKSNAYYQAALSKADSEHEKRFILMKINELGDK